jgi:hypothetical protein
MWGSALDLRQLTHLIREYICAATLDTVLPLLHNVYIPYVIVNCPMDHTCVDSHSDVRRWCRGGEVHQLRGLSRYLLGILFNYASYSQELYAIERDHRSQSGDCFAEYLTKLLRHLPGTQRNSIKNETDLCPGPCLVDLCPGDVQFPFCMAIRNKASAFL